MKMAPNSNLIKVKNARISQNLKRENIDFIIAFLRTVQARFKIMEKTMFYLLIHYSYFIVFTLFISTSHANSDVGQWRAVVNTSLDHRGQISYDIQIGTAGKVSGGVLCGAVKNSGEINDLAICAEAVVTGGRVSGTVLNRGTLCDTMLTPNAQVNGGTLCGLIQNQGIIANVTLKSDTVIKGGILQGNIQGDAAYPAYLGALTVAMGSQLCGVKLSPTVQLEKNVTLCDNVIRPQNPEKPSLRDFNIDVPELESLTVQQLQRLEEEAFRLFTARHLARLPPALFAVMNSNHIKKLTWKSVRGLTINQFNQLPIELLSAFTRENLGALSPDIVKQLTIQQLVYLKPTIRRLPEREVVMFLTSVSTDIPTKELSDIIPATWKMDETTGDLIAPKNANLSFRKLDNSKSVPAQVDLEYDLPDMNMGLGIAGQTSRMSLLQQIRQAMSQSGLSKYEITQQADGILWVSDGKIQFTLIPDIFTMQQMDSDTPVGVSINVNGNYQVVTPDYTVITFVPVPKNFSQLTALFGESSQIKCNKRGDALLQIPAQYLRRGGRDDEDVNVVSVFDPFVEPAPEEFCKDDVCDWTGASDSMQPGIVWSEDDARAQTVPKITYTDGTSQKIYPTVLQSDVFIEEALKMTGVESVIFNNDGTFSVRYQAKQFRLYPSFQTQKTTIEEGREFSPQIIVNPDNTVSYQVQDEENVFTFLLNIGV